VAQGCPVSQSFSQQTLTSPAVPDLATHHQREALLCSQWLPTPHEHSGADTWEAPATWDAYELLSGKCKAPSSNPSTAKTQGVKASCQDGETVRSGVRETWGQVHRRHWLRKPLRSPPVTSPSDGSCEVTSWWAGPAVRDWLLANSSCPLSHQVLPPPGSPLGLRSPWPLSPPGHGR
jgi:hypothetical protein